MTGLRKDLPTEAQRGTPTTTCMMQRGRHITIALLVGSRAEAASSGVGLDRVNADVHRGRHSGGGLATNTHVYVNI